MRKWIFLLALTVALSLFGLLPSKSQDVAALLPCQTLAVDAECVREPLAFVSKRADGPLLQLFVGVGVPGLKAGV